MGQKEGELESPVAHSIRRGDAPPPTTFACYQCGLVRSGSQELAAAITKLAVLKC